MKECQFCGKSFKGKAVEHYASATDCYKLQQRELSRRWKKSGGDIPGCYQRACDVCGEPVYGEHPQTLRHAGPCALKVRAQRVAARLKSTKLRRRFLRFVRPFADDAQTLRHVREMLDVTLEEVIRMSPS
ncbi:MAG: hypothetical protein AB7O38_12590 [Pirellulaceae bacterium]